MDKWPGYTNEDYEKLKDALNRARNICPPDEYQQRHNQLLRDVTEFLLKPLQWSYEQQKPAECKSFDKTFSKEYREKPR